EFMDAVRSVGPTGSGEGGQGRPDAAQDARAQSSPAQFGDGPPGRVPTRRGPSQATYSSGGGQAGAPRNLSPLVRRLVAQHNVDISQLRGTGMGGRITKDDVLRHVHGQSERLQSVRAEAGDTPNSAFLPLTPLRKTIAEHMTRSAREIPSAWTMVEADVTGLVHWRSVHKDAFRHAHGVSLTYLPAAALLVAQALREHPRLNAQWDGERILLHNRVNMGVAVSTDAGLIVPVVHDADTLSLSGIAKRIADLADGARSQSLRLEDVQGGTFTLNNTGALGSVVSVPIINHPQAAILTTEAIVKRPVVVQGDAIAVRSMMNLCLTFDHRVIDGAEASAFLQAVKSRLEAINEQTPLE
ncbi:MAG: dihydrolipoamide acetyltransferase family protein, partial [Dehalococcoidia bacterium]